MVAVPIS